MDHVPHVWKTTDEDGSSVQHLCMNEEGAIQAHLLHHGMFGYSKEIKIEDLGRLTANDSGRHCDRKEICFDAMCVLYGLSFPE